MYKKSALWRITAIFMTCIMLMTFVSPVSAMGFDDLENVYDITDGSNYDHDEPSSASTPADKDEIGDGDEYTDTGNPEASTEPQPESEEVHLENEEAPATLGLSGVDEWEPLPDSGVISFATSGISTFSLTNSITYTADYSIQHIWPFSGGASAKKFPIYLFRTTDGKAAYCIEPAKFNSSNGHAVTGSLTYSGLSTSKQNEIARAVAANTAGTSNTRMYAATQAIIWEIAAGQSHRSGNIYSAVITANGLSSEYESIMSAMSSLNGEIPSFMGSDKNNAPYHEMQESGGSWSVSLTNTNSNVTLNASDFKSIAAINFSVSGNTLTVKSSNPPASDMFAEWSSSGGDNPGVIFWLNDTIQDKITVDAVPGVGYMRFDESAPPPPEEEETEERIGYLHIHKYNGVDNEPLSGAIFRIEAENFLDEAFHVDGGSTLVIPIPKGKDSVEVRVTEVQPPNGFIGSTETKVVTVYPHDVVNLVEVSFINYPKPSSLTIYKHEKGKEAVPLAGARFRLRYADAKVSAQTWEFTTDQNGKWTIDPLPSAGTLVLEELESPDGYVMGEQTTWTITVAVGEHKIFSVSNDKKAELIAIKRDSVTGQELGGAVIKATLLRSHTEPYESGIVYTVTTEYGTGKAHFKGLIPGEYRVEEVSPPPFYLGTTTVHTVNVYDGSVETVTVLFENDRYSGLTLVKVCSVTGNPLKGAIFSLYRGTEVHNTDFLGDYQSNENGMVVIQNLESNQWYTVVEKQAPYGYELDPVNRVQTVFLKPEDINQNLTIYFRNPPKPKLLIQKTDSAGNPLGGAVFRLSKEDSADYIEITTDPITGSVLIENLEETWYTCWEIRSPEGYVLDDQKHIVELKAGRTTTLVVENKSLPKLRLRKIDEQTLKGIEGVTLRITKEGAAQYQDVITGSGGIIDLKLEPGWYFVQEQVAKPGYILDDTVHYIEIKANEDTELVITNRKKPSLKIIKLCSVTKQPLQASFEVKVKNGRSLGTFTTDPETGELLIDNLEYYNDPLILEIEEVRAPDGYLITQQKMEVTVGWGENKVIEWYNTPENPLLIYKMDKDGNPVPNTEFLVTTVNGTYIGYYKSGPRGVAVIAGQKPGWYLVTETKTGSDEFILDSTPYRVELKYGEPAVLEIINDRRPTLEILKLNKADNTPMPNVLIRVERMSGELIGDFRTDNEGRITLQTDPGWVVCYELETLPGFILDQTRVKRELKPNKTETIELYNVPLPGLQLRKTCSVTGKPLTSVEYTFHRLNGSLIGTYKTDELGIIYLDIDETYVVITEVRTVDGYRLDDVPRTVQLTPGGLTVVSYTNVPYPTLEIIKKDATSKNVLPNVKFKLFDRYMREVGVYKTNSLGRIVLSGMSEGKYYLQEYETSGPEYVLDKTVHEVTLSYGKTTTIELFNTRMGTFRLRKICSETSKPLTGATYLFYDEKNNVLFEKTTNAYGIIEFEESLEPQKLKIKEISAPNGFVLDSTVHEVVIKAGETTEITLKNTPEKGRIQIIKIASEDSQINKVKKGDGLSGAVFEVFNERLELMDTIKTDKRGIGESEPLPLGRYVIKEVKSPAFFYSDGKPIYCEIKLHDDLIKFKVENKPEEIEVDVTKRGVVECLPGDVITYDFSNITNLSTCSLDEFYWQDNLPTDALRIESLNTGTWSQRVKFDVYIQTNQKTSWRKIKSNLHSNVEYTIDLRSSALGLASNEYVTSYKLVFGEVEAGFIEKKAPFIVCRVLDSLPDGYRFTNRTEVGGRRNKEWVYQKDSWVTVIFRRKPLPKTGF